MGEFITLGPLAVERPLPLLGLQFRAEFLLANQHSRKRQTYVTYCYQELPKLDKECYSRIVPHHHTGALGLRFLPVGATLSSFNI